MGTYNGTVVGSPTFGAAKFSNGLTAMSDANNISLTTSPFNFGLTANWTVEFWIKFTSTGTKIIVGFGASTNEGYFKVTAGKVSYGNTGTGAFAADMVSAATCNDNAWHHIRWTCAGGTTIKVSIDGVLDSTFTGVTTAVPTGNSTIGAYNGHTGFSFPGAVDEIAVFSSTLTSTYTPPSAAYTGTESGLVALYHLEADGTDSAGTTAKYDIVTGTSPVTGQNIQVHVPNVNAAIPYNSANPTDLIIYCHARSGDQTEFTTDANAGAMRDAFADAGLLVIQSNAHGNQWGNQEACDDYADAFNYANANYNVNRVILMSASMGGAAMFNCCSQQKIPKVIALLGLFPVCSLDNMITAGTYASEIHTAFGASAPPTMHDAARGMDPVLRWGSAFRGTFIRLYASPSDTTVSKAGNSDLMNTLAASSSRECTVVVCSGAHGDASHYQPTDATDFIARAQANAPATSGQIGAGTGLDMTQTVELPSGDTVTLKEALAGAYLGGNCPQKIIGSALKQYLPNGTTIVKTWTLDDPSAPTSKT